MKCAMVEHMSEMDNERMENRSHGRVYGQDGQCNSMEEQQSYKMPKIARHDE